MPKLNNCSILLEEGFRKEFIGKAISKLGSQERLANYLDSKIKSRHITKENVKSWRAGKHFFGYNLLIPIEVVKKLCLINKVSLKVVLENTIKISPPWADPRKKRLLVRGKELCIIEKNGKKYIDLYTALPLNTLPSTRSKERLPLFREKKKNIIRLWSEASWKVSEVRLERFVEINELFFVGAALYASEGLTKIKNYNDRVQLGNTEPALIKFFIEWLSSFSKFHKLTFSINYNGKNCNEEAVKQFWSREIPQVGRKNISKISIMERPNYGSALINNFGTFSVKVSSTVFKAFILNILNVAKKLSLTNRQYGLMYLRGLLAAEGSVRAPFALKEVTIGCLNKIERKFVRKLLVFMKFSFSEGKNHFVVVGWDSFFHLYRQDAFKIQQVNSFSKLEIFLRGFRKHQKTQKLLKLRMFEDRKFSAKEWQETFRLKYYISAHKFLQPLVERDILSFDFKGNIKRYFINPNVKPFLRQIWEIENHNFFTI